MHATNHLHRAGVRLHFLDAGGGAPPLLLVHDWAGDHQSFARQIERFRTRHRVVAADLRGHGLSDAPHAPYTVAVLAADLAWLCRELGLYRPVVVGHGLGAAVALELAARHQDAASAVVALNPFVPLVPPTGEAQPLPAYVAASLWEHLATWDGAATVAACAVPVTCLTAARTLTTGRQRLLIPGLPLLQVSDSGHYLQIDAPEAVHAAIDQVFMANR